MAARMSWALAFSPAAKVKSGGLRASAAAVALGLAVFLRLPMVPAPRRSDPGVAGQKASAAVMPVCGQVGRDFILRHDGSARRRLKIEKALLRNAAAFGCREHVLKDDRRRPDADAE